MRKSLFIAAAAAALFGYATTAPAQTMQNTGAGAGTAAKSENTRPAESQGALSGALKGDTTGGASGQGIGSQGAKPMHGPSSSEKAQ